MHRILEIDPSYQDGIAHVYLGVLNCLMPEALGGKPQTGKMHFETAIELSDGKNLMIKVLFAQFYARLVFDQQLHNSILDDVINAEVNVPGYTLSNVIAQKRAETLIDSSADYF
jgi:hypothetical protein